MSADRVDVGRCLVCLPGHCTLSLVGGGAVLANGPEAKETRTPDPLHAMQVLFGSNPLARHGQSKSIKFLEQFLE